MVRPSPMSKEGVTPRESVTPCSLFDIVSVDANTTVCKCAARLKKFTHSSKLQKDYSQEMGRFKGRMNGRIETRKNLLRAPATMFCGRGKTLPLLHAGVCILITYLSL